MFFVYDFPVLSEFVSWFTLERIIGRFLYSNINDGLNWVGWKSIKNKIEVIFRINFFDKRFRNFCLRNACLKFLSFPNGMKLTVLKIGGFDNIEKTFQKWWWENNLSIPDLWNNLQEIFCWFLTTDNLLGASLGILVPQKQTLNRLEQSQYPKCSYKQIDKVDIITILIASAD